MGYRCRLTSGLSRPCRGASAVSDTVGSAARANTAAPRSGLRGGVTGTLMRGAVTDARRICPASLISRQVTPPEWAPKSATAAADHDQGPAALGPQRCDDAAGAHGVSGRFS
jgi:hypothetical protein